MKNVFHGHALCQAAMLEGMSKRAESAVEARIRFLWERSGPQFCIDTLKVIKQHTLDNIVDDKPYTHVKGEPSVAWRYDLDRPKGPLGSLYSQFPDPEDRARAIGALLNSLEFEEESPKQLRKLVSGVRSKTRSESTASIPKPDLQQLNARIKARVKHHEAYGPMALTASVLPYAHYSVNIQTLREGLLSDDPDRRHSSTVALHDHAVSQFRTAPRVLKKSWNAILDASYGVRFPEKEITAVKVCGFDPPDWYDSWIRRRIPSKFHSDGIQAREYDSLHATYGWLNLSMAHTDSMASDYLGQMVFLQQPGGKLRSIANVNRFVNWVMEPFASAIQDVYYSRPAIAVLDQGRAVDWVQDQLRKGMTLASFDLTSATDLLDFRVVTRGLRERMPKDSPLVLYCNLFDELAEHPLWSEGLGCAIQFSTGQPLGMKGSFQILTLMNYLAGSQAAQSVGLTEDSFRVVGDDFICDARMASAYDQIITSWGGKTNKEKALCSSEYGEFLSHLITPSTVIPLKPRYRLGRNATFSNLEKAVVRNHRGLYRLSKTDKEAIAILSEYSVEKYDDRYHLPRLRSKGLQQDTFHKDVMEQSLRLAAEWSAESEDHVVTRSQLSLRLAAAEQSAAVFAPSRREDGEPLGSPLALEEELSFSSAVERYDHHTGKTSRVKSRADQHRETLKRAKLMSELDAQMRSNPPPPKEVSLGLGQSVSSEDLVIAASAAVHTDRRHNPADPETRYVSQRTDPESADAALIELQKDRIRKKPIQWEPLPEPWKGTQQDDHELSL